MLLLGLLFGLLSVSQIEGTEYFIDEAYFGQLSLEYFDPIRTRAAPVWVEDEDDGLAINLTITKQIPADAVGYFKLYGKGRGESEPSIQMLSVHARWCELWEEPVIFNSLGAALGITVDNCPPPIGDYHASRWQPPIKDKKILFGAGDHKATYTLTLNEKTLLSLVCYLHLY